MYSGDMSSDASIVSVSGPSVEETAYGYVGTVKGNCFGSMASPCFEGVEDDWSIRRP